MVNYLKLYAKILTLNTPFKNKRNLEAIRPKQYKYESYCKIQGADSKPNYAYD